MPDLFVRKNSWDTEANGWEVVGESAALIVDADSLVISPIRCVLDYEYLYNLLHFILHEKSKLCDYSTLTLAICVKVSPHSNTQCLIVREAATYSISINMLYENIVTYLRRPDLALGQLSTPVLLAYGDAEERSIKFFTGSFYSALNVRNFGQIIYIGHHGSLFEQLIDEGCVASSPPCVFKLDEQERVQVVRQMQQLQRVGMQRFHCYLDIDDTLLDYDCSHCSGSTALNLEVVKQIIALKEEFFRADFFYFDCTAVWPGAVERQCCIC